MQKELTKEITDSPFERIDIIPQPIRNLDKLKSIL